MSEAKKLGFQIKCSIQIVAGPHAGKEYFFEESPILIGRGIENQIVLANDSKTSRAHLEIRVEKDGIYARSLSKTNPTFLNGTVIGEQKIPNLCHLILGETEISIEVHSDIPTSKGLSIVQESVEAKPKNAILNSAANPTVNLTVKGNTVAAPQVKITESPKAMDAKKIENIVPQVKQVPEKRNSNKPSVAMAPELKRKSRPKPPPQSAPLPAFEEKSSMNFYIIVGIVVVVGFFLFSGNKDKVPKVDANKPRLTTDIDIEFRSYDELMKEFDARKARIGTRNFQMAQENFVRGFRDYRQGQYARAKESFQVVINLDSENEMARRYFQLAKLKFDEMVKFHMLQGKRYHDKKNWRLCKSGYFNAMTMLQNNQSDPLFIESERYYKICSSALEGRF